MFGNFIDLGVIFYILIVFLASRRKSNLDILLVFLSLILALAAALYTYGLTAGFLADNFQMARAYTNVLGFFLNAFIFKRVFLLIFEQTIKKNRDDFNIKNVHAAQALKIILVFLSEFFMIFVMLSVFASLALPGVMVAQIDQSRIGQIVKSDPLKMNGKLHNIFGDILSTALKDFNFMQVRTGEDEKVDLGFKALDVKVDADLEEKMLAMVNQERTSRGLKALKMNEEARKAARDYGTYLFKNGIFSHTDLEGKGPGDRMKKYDVSFEMVGENLAYAPGLEEAHQGLMNSKGHRENILHPFFSRVGIGVIDGGTYGMIFVQEFLN